MKSYRKYYTINASRADIYNVITNKVMIEIWTGESAEMDTIPNSPFSLWDGAINGHNIEFEENFKIVQEWYFGEDESSIVTIKLHDKGEEGTSVEVKQTNIPDDAYENIAAGWEEDYLGAINELFDK